MFEIIIQLVSQGVSLQKPDSQASQKRRKSRGHNVNRSYKRWNKFLGIDDASLTTFTDPLMYSDIHMKGDICSKMKLSSMIKVIIFLLVPFHTNISVRAYNVSTKGFPAHFLFLMMYTKAREQNAVSCEISLLLCVRLRALLVESYSCVFLAYDLCSDRRVGGVTFLPFLEISDRPTNQPTGQPTRTKNQGS